MKNNPKEDKKNKKLRAMRKPTEYELFINWIALPRIEREPRTQEEFAKKFGLHPGTLSEWKRKKGFYKKVRKIRKKWIRDRLGDVLWGVFRKAVKEGNAAEAKLLLQYGENWIPKEGIRTEDKTYEDYVKETFKQLNTLRQQVLNRKGFLDKRQRQKKGEVHSEQDTKDLRAEKDQSGHHSEGQTEGI